MLQHITDSLYQQGIHCGSESRAELEAQLETNRCFLIQSTSLMHESKMEAESDLKKMAKSCEHECCFMLLVGQVDREGLDSRWKTADASVGRYMQAQDIHQAIRDRIDEILVTLSDATLWEQETK